MAARDQPLIRIDGVSKSFPYAGRDRPILKDLSITLPGRRSTALLGRNGAGKSTLLQLIAGNLRPDRGHVSCTGTVSWQVGFSGAFHPELTGAQNARFVARVHGVDSADLTEFVADFTELAADFYKPVRTYSHGMKARLTFGLSMAIAFDTYLVDEITATGDAAFRRKSRAVFHDRLSRAGAIVVSHNIAELQDLCEAALVLENGRLCYFDRLEDGIAAHNRNLGLKG